MLKKIKTTSSLTLKILSCLAVASFSFDAKEASANHDVVRPETYPSFNWRDPYGWYSNPNRPRYRYSPSRNEIGEGFQPSQKSVETFVVPDANSMSWEEASRLCDRDGGRLTWRRDRKVCVR